MKKFIPYFTRLFTYFLIFKFIISCNFFSQATKEIEKNDLRQMKSLMLGHGNQQDCFKVYLAQSQQEQTRGLSFFQPEELSVNEGMLFIFEETGIREFWMPSTFFDLDLYFLNEQFYILDQHLGLKSFPHSEPRHLIPRSKKVRAKMVLEVHPQSALSQKLYPGLKLSICE
jgi:uncharacterized membrane protein (UPF0127 family)